MDIIQKLLTDLRLPRRREREMFADLAGLNEIVEESLTLPLVYCAFDGDQQQLCSLMRKAVLAEQKVPVSPPSILGYRDVVVTRREKKRVLRDDLALLRRCDEMWVFCERDLRQEGLGSLAEGLVVELLYAHQFCPKMPIYFVNVRSLLIGEIEKDAYPIDLNKSGSKSEQSQFISELHSFVLESERLIPKVQYYLMDPLDFKYAEWLRVGPHRKAFVPIVPFLAIELSDVDRTSSAQRHLIRAWLTLMRLADEFACVTPLHEQSEESLWLELASQTLQKLKKRSLTTLDWAQFDIPKATEGGNWSITSKEANLVEQVRARRVYREKAAI